MYKIETIVIHNLRKSNTYDRQNAHPVPGASFGLTWSIAAMLILFLRPGGRHLWRDHYQQPAVHPGRVLARHAGVFLVWRHYGLEGLGSFFKRLTLWRAPVKWWLFLILGIPAVVYTGAAIKGSLSDPFPFSSWYCRCCQRWRLPCSSAPLRSSAGAELPCRFCSADSPRSGRA